MPASDPLHTDPDTHGDTPPSGTRPVDPAALAHIRARLDRSPHAPWLHAEVARRMAQRLGVVRLQPQRVLDWGAHQGASRALLQAQYPRAELVAVESDTARVQASAELLRDAAPWWRPRGWARPPEVWPEAAWADRAGPAAPAPAQLLWANMALHARTDPLATLRLWHRALAVDGFLMFSTLGPGTLDTLRTLYTEKGWGPPHAPFVDMHDLGDMLVEAGFADPVMDQETLTLHWADAAALLQELRGLGGNAARRRFAGLRTPRWRDRLLQALQTLVTAAGRPALRFEIVYGHAFRPPPRVRVSGLTTVAVEDLRAMARAQRIGRPSSLR